MLSKTFYTATLLLGTAASFALADYAISAPGTGVVWNAGDSVKVLWGASGNNVEPQVDVRLVKGPASNLQFVKNLCSNIDPTVGECDYTVESSLASGRDYAIEVGKSPANYGYSSFFTIQATGELPQQAGCPNFGGQNCPSSLPCCSSAGYCGATDAYCGTGCMAQYSFNGECVAPGATTSATTSTTSSADPVTSATTSTTSATTSTTSATTSTTSAADPTTSAEASTTSAADPTINAADPTINAADPTTSAATSTTTSAEDQITSAAAQAKTQPLGGSDYDHSYGPSYGPSYGRPGNGKGQFLNLDPMDSDFGNDLGEAIHNYGKDIEKGIKAPGFGPKHKQPKRRRGILRL